MKLDEVNEIYLAPNENLDKDLLNTVKMLLDRDYDIYLRNEEGAVVIEYCHAPRLALGTPELEWLTIEEKEDLYATRFPEKEAGSLVDEITGILGLSNQDILKAEYKEDDERKNKCNFFLEYSPYASDDITFCCQSTQLDICKDCQRSHCPKNTPYSVGRMFDASEEIKSNESK